MSTPTTPRNGSVSPRPRPSNIFGLRKKKEEEIAARAFAKEHHAEIVEQLEKNAEHQEELAHERELKEKAREKEKKTFVALVADVLSRKTPPIQVQSSDIETIYDMWDETPHKPEDYVAFKKYVLATIDDWLANKKEDESLTTYLDLPIMEQVEENSGSNSEFKHNVGVIRQDEKAGHPRKRGWFGWLGRGSRRSRRSTRSSRRSSRKTRRRKN